MFIVSLSLKILTDQLSTLALRASSSVFFWIFTSLPHVSKKKTFFNISVTLSCLETVVLDVRLNCSASLTIVLFCLQFGSKMNFVLSWISVVFFCFLSLLCHFLMIIISFKFYCRCSCMESVFISIVRFHQVSNLLGSVLPHCFFSVDKNLKVMNSAGYMCSNSQLFSAFSILVHALASDSLGSPVFAREYA